MKKLLIKSLTILSLLGITMSVVSALSTYSSCTLKIGQRSASTASVGVSTSAEAYGICYSYSEKACNFYVMAAWTGWPYTSEYATSIYPGKTITHLEHQSRNSNFYVQLENLSDATGYKAQAFGSITAK